MIVCIIFLVSCAEIQNAQNSENLEIRKRSQLSTLSTENEKKKMATNSLAFQMYALEHGLEDLVDSDKSNVTEKKNEVPKSFDWTAVESDSSSDEDDDEQSPLAVKVKKPIARDDDDDDESSSDDEDVTGINVNWLDDSDEEVEEDDDDEVEARTKTSVNVQSNKKSSAKIADLVPFFRSPKQHIRIAVATQVAGLSSTVEGRNLINSPLIMQHLCRLLGGDDKEAKPALQALINMCQLRMFKLNLAKTGIVKRLINSVMDKSQRNLRNLQCMLLSNVTQDARGSRELLDLDGESKGRPVGTWCSSAELENFYQLAFSCLVRSKIIPIAHS